MTPSPRPAARLARAWRRVLVALVAVVATSVTVGWLRLGISVDASRERVARAVEHRLDDAAAAVRRTTLALGVLDRQRVSDALAGDDDAARDLFDRVRQAREAGGLAVRAVTLLTTSGRPVAWDGQPLPGLPPLSASASALRVAVAPVGARLVQAMPVRSGPPGAEVAATLVTEVFLADTVTSGAQAAVVDTDVVPVEFWASAPNAPGVRVVRPAGSQEPAGYLQIPAGRIEAARRQWQVRTVAALATVVLAGVLVSATSLPFARAVIVVASVRLAAWPVLSLWGVPRRADAGWLDGWISSPADLLVTSLAVTWLTAALLYGPSRRGLRRRVTAAQRGWPQALRAVISAGLGTIVLSGALALVPHAMRWWPVDTTQDLLHPIDLQRLASLSGLMLLAASTVWALAAAVRVLAGPWRRHLGSGAWLPVLCATLGIAAAALVRQDAPVVPPALLMLAGAQAGPRLISRFRHRSRLARLAGACALVVLPTLACYPALVQVSSEQRHAALAGPVAAEVMSLRTRARAQLEAAQRDIDALPELATWLRDLQSARGTTPDGDSAAFRVWSSTPYGRARLTSAIELAGSDGRRLGRFSLKLPEADDGPPALPTPDCAWETFEEVSRFYAEERRVLHSSRGVCAPASDSGASLVGAISLSLVPDFANLPFLAARTPYAALLQGPDVVPLAHEDVELTVYGWSRRVLFSSAGQPWSLPDPVMERLLDARTPFWASLTRPDGTWDVYLLNDRAAIYAIGMRRVSVLMYAVRVAELLLLSVGLVLGLVLTGALLRVLSGEAPMTSVGLLADVRESFYRKLFLGFVAAVAVPVVALAVVARVYMAAQLRADIEREASRVAASASRLAADLATPPTSLPIDDTRLVWLARAVDQDVNVFEGPDLLASSERALYAAGLLPLRTPADAYRAVALDGQSTHVSRERLGAYEYLVVSAPVRRGARDVVLSVPLSLQQQQTERQVDELDRRVVLAAMTFVLLGGLVGYWMAERIADPMRRLTRATRRLANGDLDARVLVTSRDEFRRLVEDFNRMAEQLGQQRTALERTQRLEAWAEAARQVAHDIKNPLMPIQLNAEHLRRVHADRGRPLDPVLEACVSSILAQVRVLRQMASEFASFAATPRAVPARVRVPSLVADLLAPYGTALDGRIRLEVTHDADQPDAWADAALLGRAFINVVENAVHAMPGTGTLRVQVGHEAGTVTVVVADTGVGMDAASMARIFEPYFSTRATGSGLGLSIARRNLEALGGSITVTSAPGEGTTVTLRVPEAGDR